MRCRPGLLRVLVAVPSLAAAGYLGVALWQTWLGPTIHDYSERKRERADTARRVASHRTAGGAVQAFAAGGVQPGESLDAVAARFRPALTHRLGRYTRAVFDDPRPAYRYGDAWVEVLARDGRVVAASWHFRVRSRAIANGRLVSANDPFFDTTPADRAAYAAEQKAWWAAHREAAMAVAGPLGYTGYHDPPR